MISLIQTLNPIFDIGWWVLLIAFFIVGVRAYPLTALRSIAVHFVVALVTVPIGQWLVMHIQRPPEPTLFNPRAGSLGFTFASTSLISSAADFVVLVLALAEITSLIARAYPEPRAWLSQQLLSAYRHVPLLGLSAVALALLYPLPALIYRLAHDSPTA